MHRMVESTVEGVVVPSSACVRGASYSAHRAHVVRGIGKRRKAPDCRFRKISGPRTFGAGRARLVCQPRCPTLYLAHNPHTPHAGAHRTGRVRMPAPRRSSFPLAREEGWVSLAATERTLRGAAADMSIHYFAAIPGVAALVRLQGALAWAEQHMKGSPHGCPFVGTSTHLYPKGSMGKMATKGGHDDNNPRPRRAGRIWARLHHRRVCSSWWWCMVTTSCWRPRRARWLSSRHGCPT